MKVLFQRSLLLSLCMCLLSGCGGGGQQIDGETVRGIVYCNDDPVPGGIIAFVNQSGMVGSAEIGPSGDYEAIALPQGNVQIYYIDPTTSPETLEMALRGEGPPEGGPGGQPGPGGPGGGPGGLPPGAAPGTLPPNEAMPGGDMPPDALAFLKKVADKYGPRGTDHILYSVKPGEQTFDIKMTLKK